MLTRLLAACLVLAALLPAWADAPAGNRPLVLENEHVAVAIDAATGGVRSITDKRLKAIYPLAGIGFEAATNTATLKSERAVAAEAAGGGATLRFAGAGLAATLRYSLGPDDRFVEKWVELEPAEGQPVVLTSVVVEDATSDAFSAIHFHDDQTIWHCPINLFLRGEKGGCFAGLEYPWWELEQKAANAGKGFRLGYAPHERLEPGRKHVGEKYFLGVYRREGIQRVSQGPYPGRGRSPLLDYGHTGLAQQFKTGQVPPVVEDVPLETLDWGEVWAMQDFMRRIQPDDLQLPEEGYWIWQNGWWAGLFDPKPEILDAIKAAGIHDIMTAHTWYGRGNHPNAEPYLAKMRIDPLGFPLDAAVAGLPGAAGPAAGWHAPQEVKLDTFKPGEFTPDFRAPPAMQKFIDHGKRIGVHVSSFAVPGILFEAKPEWWSLDEQGKPSQYLFGRGVSCPASDDYTKHLLALHEAAFAAYQPRWWGWDGRWMSYWEVPRYRPGPAGLGPDPCHAKDHGHPPGDNRYREWRNIMGFLRDLRSRHPRLCMEVYYGLKRGEPWALRNLNAADNYYESSGADINRMEAWHNQNDRFRPVYKNYFAVFGGSPQKFRFNVIAALASSAYCQIGPAFADLANAENRDFLKQWRAWASEHHKYLKVKRDLFDCPGDSAVDGSAHMIGDRGFVFLFPGGFDRAGPRAGSVRAAIPLHRWIGLDENASAVYRVRELHPRVGTDLGVYRYGEDVLFDAPLDSAAVLAVEPAAAGSAPQRPPLPESKEPAVRAFPVVAPVSPAGPAGTEMRTLESSKLVVRFDATAIEPAELVNVETGERQALTPCSAFRLELYPIKTDLPTLAAEVAEKKARPAVIDARDCTITDVQEKQLPDGGHALVVTYEGDLGRVTVTHSLGRDDHFMQKEVRFEPSFPEPYLLWRVEAQRFRLASPVAEYVPFVHGCCLTHFLRHTKGGFLAGVQVPTLVPLYGSDRKVLPVPKELHLDPETENALAYGVNFRFGPGEAYVAEKVFWGCCRLTGIRPPPAPSNISAGRGGSVDRQSPVPPDIGESEAMAAMVRKLARPGPRGIHVTLNGWDSDLSMKGYGSAADPQVVEKDIGILAQAKERLGDFEVTLASTWGGVDHEVATLTPEDTVPPATPGATKLLDWAREQGIGINLWTVHSGPNPWSDLNEYCPTHKEWNAAGHTCPANREYMAWHTRLACAMARRGYCSYAEDEHFVLQGQVNCTSPLHDHLPGNCNYGWFRLRHELYRALRREFGEAFQVHGYRPQMDLGIWECLPVDNVFTLHDDVPIGGDRIRTWARIRHFYHFLPSWKDQALIKNQFTDHDMLSALAVSSTYLIMGKPDATARKWLDWARQHPDHMQGQAVFLPDWPGHGACDASVRTAHGTGFAFVFNANAEDAEVTLPLDASVGLDPARSYRLAMVHPGEKAFEPVVAKGSWRGTLPPGAAWLIEITPAGTDVGP